MSTLRQVLVYEYQKSPATDNKPYEFTWEKIVVGRGSFHQWGVDVDHGEGGSGTYSIAIVEMEDGAMKAVPVDLVVFEDPLCPADTDNPF